MRRPAPGRSASGGRLQLLRQGVYHAFTFIETHGLLIKRVVMEGMTVKVIGGHGLELCQEMTPLSVQPVTHLFSYSSLKVI